LRFFNFDTKLLSSEITYQLERLVIAVFLFQNATLLAATWYDLETE